MIQKTIPSNLSTLRPNALTSGSLETSFISKELTPLVKTPRCVHFKKEDSLSSSQKLTELPIANTQKVRLPSLNRIRTDLKENLFDLDLCFDMETLDHFEKQQESSRQNFIIALYTFMQLCKFLANASAVSTLFTTACWASPGITSSRMVLLTGICGSAAAPPLVLMECL